MPKIEWKFALIIFLIIAYLIADKLYFSPKIAYISTTKLLVSFSDAAKAEKELKAEDDKGQGQLKQLQDSLQAAMDQMGKEFNQATIVRKKEMQDMLSARNQQINNFRQANIQIVGIWRGMRP